MLSSELRARLVALVAESKRWPPAPWKSHEHAEAGWGWLVGDGPEDDSADKDRSFCAFGDGDYDADLAEYIARLVEAPTDIAALLAHRDRLEAELEAVAPHTRDTEIEPDAEVLAAPVTCDCCTTEIPAGESAVLFVDEQGRACWAHYAACPEPNLWRIEYMPRSSRVRAWEVVIHGGTGDALLLPYEDALTYARALKARARLIRVRRKRPPMSDVVFDCAGTRIVVDAVVEWIDANGGPRRARVYSINPEGRVHVVEQMANRRGRPRTRNVTHHFDAHELHRLRVVGEQ